VERRQTLPDRWFVLTGPESIDDVRRLPRDTGVLVLPGLSPRDLREVRRAAVLRRLSLIMERPGAPLRVHNMRELRRALGAQTTLILISPLYTTRSHPDWKPLPSMRAATLARLAGRRAIALGGMDARRYAKIARLGFIGWAGISAFRT
jgi:thiamine-phosphate pyrophosphorylase